MKADTLFRLYSQTKPVTIVGFARLLERGLVRVEDPLSKYIPAFADANVLKGKKLQPLLRPIAIRDLLAHSSGIGFGPGFGFPAENDYEEMYVDLVKRVDEGEIVSLEAWVDELAKLPLRFQPGKDWGYGYSSDVLGRVVEVISGRRLDEFLSEEVLVPLSMLDTAFGVPEEKAGRLAALHNRDPWDGSGRKLVKHNIVDPDAAGLVSSLADYARFGQMLLNGGELDGVRVLRPESLRLLGGDWLNANGSKKRKKPMWVWGNPGIGFSPFGQVGVRHPDAPARR